MGAVMDNTLGIMVSSDDHYDYILKIAEAGHKKGKEITIFFTGKGVLLTRQGDFDKLNSYATVKICEVSFRANNLTGDVPGVGFKDFVTQATHAEMVADVDRYLVF